MSHSWNLDFVYISKDFKIFKVDVNANAIGINATDLWRKKVFVSNNEFNPGIMSKLSAKKFCSNWQDLNTNGSAKIDNSEVFIQHVSKFFKPR